MKKISKKRLVELLNFISDANFSPECEKCKLLACQTHVHYEKKVYSAWNYRHPVMDYGWLGYHKPIYDFKNGVMTPEALRVRIEEENGVYNF